jgi:hypothetical protein
MRRRMWKGGGPGSNQYTTKPAGPDLSAVATATPDSPLVDGADPMDDYTITLTVPRPPANTSVEAPSLEAMTDQTRALVSRHAIIEARMKMRGRWGHTDQSLVDQHSGAIQDLHLARQALAAMTPGPSTPAGPSWIDPTVEVQVSNDGALRAAADTYIDRAMSTLQFDDRDLGAAGIVGPDQRRDAMAQLFRAETLLQQSASSIAATSDSATFTPPAPLQDWQVASRAASNAVLADSDDFSSRGEPKDYAEQLRLVEMAEAAHQREFPDATQAGAVWPIYTDEAVARTITGRPGDDPDQRALNLHRAAEHLKVKVDV